MKKSGASYIDEVQYNVPKGGNRKYSGRSMHEDKIDLSNKKGVYKRKHTPKKGFVKYFKFDSMIIHAKSGDIHKSHVVGLSKIRKRYPNADVTYLRDLGGGEVVQVRNNNFLAMNSTWLFDGNGWTMKPYLMNKREIAESGASEAFYENSNAGVSSDVRFSIEGDRVTEIWA